MSADEIRVRDIWLALHITRWWFGVCLFLSVLVGALLWGISIYVMGGALVASLNSEPNTVAIGLGISSAAFCLFATLITTVMIFLNYNRGIVIDLRVNSVSWPASDIENSLIDIITFKSFRKHLRREVVELQEVMDVRNDTTPRGSSDRYRLNVGGTFGSRQLEFSNKQKRDECRMRLLAGMRTVGRSPTRDSNFDHADSSD